MSNQICEMEISDLEIVVHNKNDSNLELKFVDFNEFMRVIRRSL